MFQEETAEQIEVEEVYDAGSEDNSDDKDEEDVHDGHTLSPEDSEWSKFCNWFCIFYYQDIARKR